MKFDNRVIVLNKRLELMEKKYSLLQRKYDSSAKENDALKNKLLHYESIVNDAIKSKGEYDKSMVEIERIKQLYNNYVYEARLLCANLKKSSRKYATVLK